MLDVHSLQAWYGQAEVVRGVSFGVGAGEIVAVVGDNGAGKTTLARAVTGLHEAARGRVAVDGRDVPLGRAIDAARAGIALVPQGRRIFRSLTVGEHIAIAERQARPGALGRAEVFALFPRLDERLAVRARSLSGGEQQMLAIARAVAVGPSVLVLDEPTEGLAPTMVEAVAGVVRHLAGTGVAVLLLEQHGGVPVAMADRVIEMQRGSFLHDGAEPAAAALAKGGNQR